MTAGSDPGNTQMPIQQQSQSGGLGCQKVMGALTLLMLVAMVAMGVLAWNSVGGLFGGVRERIESVVDSIEAFPQTVADKVQEALKSETRASIERRKTGYCFQSSLGPASNCQQSVMPSPTFRSAFRMDFLASVVAQSIMLSKGLLRRALTSTR